MVAPAWRRRGGSTFGCLLSLVFFIGAIYYGIGIGEVYWRYYRIRDEIRSQARLAPGLTDDVIRRRLVARAEELNLPREARRFRIRRTSGSISIETRYEATVKLPFTERTITFHPSAVEPL